MLARGRGSPMTTTPRDQTNPSETDPTLEMGDAGAVPTTRVGHLDHLSIEEQACGEKASIPVGSRREQPMVDVAIAPGGADVASCCPAIRRNGSP